jgi:hypothetical protein
VESTIPDSPGKTVRGTRTRKIIIEIGVAAFKDLLRAMSEADKKASMATMSAELARLCARK